MRLLFSLLIITLLSLTSSSIYAGTKGKIAGKVTDSNGETLVEFKFLLKELQRVQLPILTVDTH